MVVDTRGAQLDRSGDHGSLRLRLRREQPDATERGLRVHIPLRLLWHVRRAHRSRRLPAGQPLVCVAPVQPCHGKDRKRRGALGVTRRAPRQRHHDPPHLHKMDENAQDHARLDGPGVLRLGVLLSADGDGRVQGRTGGHVAARLSLLRHLLRHYVLRRLDGGEDISVQTFQRGTDPSSANRMVTVRGELLALRPRLTTAVPLHPSPPLSLRQEAIEASFGKTKTSFFGNPTKVERGGGGRRGERKDRTSRRRRRDFTGRHRLLFGRYQQKS